MNPIAFASHHEDSRSKHLETHFLQKNRSMWHSLPLSCWHEHRPSLQWSSPKTAAYCDGQIPDISRSKQLGSLKQRLLPPAPTGKTGSSNRKRTTARRSAAKRAVTFSKTANQLGTGGSKTNFYCNALLTHM